jgi:6-phosphogluconolactonase (cycloisomerase 2 family)
MRKYLSTGLIFILLIVVTITCVQKGNTAPAPKYFAYVANSGGDNNISAYSINPSTGVLTEIKGSPFPAGIDPISMAVHPNGKYIYAVNYQSYNISAYSINPNTGLLTTIKEGPYSTESPVFVTVAPSGKFVYAINIDGYISIFKVNTATGSLTTIKGSPFRVQKRINGVAFDPSGKMVLMTDYSLNSILSYSINDTTGTLTKIRETRIKSGNPGFITIHPTGKFAFVYNRDSFSLSVYTINIRTGHLNEVKGSSFQVGRLIDVAFALTGRFVYVLRYEAIDAYSFDPTTGKLTDIKNGGYINFSDSIYPSSLAVDPNHRFLYVTHSRIDLLPNSSNAIHAFSINPTTGRLTEIKGSPFAAGDHPGSIITLKK